ncbi:pathogen-related protein-like [Neltuma alba]|uniref:pathogen-related protein-like n=1 Tax=Neltuma alba TaxID=207710 RepID=UPI0010A4E044|nr:pathogen-related protein-like [Prosopis alba]XP_028791651.1 pathogen-related protein-like [Prosopis alba]
MEDSYRTFLHGDAEKNIDWRFGAPPNYDVVNKLFEEGRTKVWPPGSLEEKVQTLLKNWEMELFHKADPRQYRSMDPDKYTFSLNGRKPITFEDLIKLGGGYNPLLQTSLPDKFKLYNPDEETAESSHKAFTTTFPRGFALEIVHVYCGPPVVVFKFRHWGYMEGPFKGHAPTGEKIELFGIGIFTLDEDEKVMKVEFFYDPAELLGPLSKGPVSDGSNEDAVSSCPIMTNTG